jgi:hypothetical protein
MRKMGCQAQTNAPSQLERVIDAVLSPTITGSVIRFGSEIENL